MTNDLIQDEWAEIKSFLQKYGRLVVYGLLAAAIVVGGVFYYHRYEARRSLLAAALYNEMLEATSQQRPGLATVAGHKLEHSFAATPYAGQGALLLARLDYEQNRIPGAIANLKFAAHHAREWTIRTVARLRLADLLLAQGHPHKAWVYANIARPYGFKAMVLGLKAQILAREGKNAAAYQTFGEAIKLAPKKSTLTVLWRREQAQLPVSP